MFRLPENQCFIISAIAAVKKEKNKMNLKSSIGPSHPISEIATSHVYRIKRLETRVIKNHVFSNKRVRAQLHTFWVSSG